MTEYENISRDKIIDNILQDHPEVLKKVKTNRRFKKKVRENKIIPEKENVRVFGVKSVNVNAILKENLYDRSMWTIDKLCRMYNSMTLEQLKKYERKKRVVPLNMLWIVMVMIGVVVVILVILFLLPRLGL